MNSVIGRLIGYLIAATTAVLNYLVFSTIASYFGAANPQFIALALTSALVIHEIAHLVALEANGVPATMFFLVIMGGASPLWGHTEKFRQLPWERQAVIALAGVVGNIAVIIGAYALNLSAYISYGDFLKIMNLNGVLILWNLFPLSVFDGGRFAKLLFNSISESKDTKYLIRLVLGFFVILILSFVISGQLNFLHLVLFFWGLEHFSKRDDPFGSQNPDAIPKPHCKWWSILFLAMISISVIITTSTPSWL